MDLNSESGNPNAPFYVMMRGVTSTQLSLILDFMYYGEANVAQEDLDPFLALAEELQVQQTTLNCRKHLILPCEFKILNLFILCSRDHVDCCFQY